VAEFRQFFNVAATFQAGTLLVENVVGDGLRIKWDITRTIEPDPDQGTVWIANLAVETRKKLEQERKLSAPFKGTLMQGWDGVVQLLMFADVYDLVPDDQTDDATVWTVLRLGDGMEAIRDGVFDKSLGDVEVSTIINIATAAMGIAMGEDAKIQLAQTLPTAQINRWTNGYSAIAPAREVLSEVLGMLKLRWTIQNGRLVIVPAGAPLPGPAILLNPHTGLIDWTTSRDGSIDVNAYSIPSAVPGAQFIVQDDLGKLVAEIAYRIQEVQFVGDTDADARMVIKGRKALI
jgi:hypothetical protein